MNPPPEQGTLRLVEPDDDHAPEDEPAYVRDLRRQIFELAEQNELLGIDIANNERENRRLRRLVTKLENDLEEKRRTAAEADRVTALLEYFRDTVVAERFRKDFALDAASGNFKVTLEVCQRRHPTGEYVYSDEQLRTCVDMLAKYPYVVSFGSYGKRVSEKIPGAKRYAGVSHAWGKNKDGDPDARIQNWLRMAEEERRVRWRITFGALCDELRRAGVPFTYANAANAMAVWCPACTQEAHVEQDRDDPERVIYECPSGCDNDALRRALDARRTRRSVR